MINNVSSVDFKGYNTNLYSMPEMNRVSFMAENKNTSDVFVNSTEKQPPEISKIRLFFRYLNDEQVKAVNECGKLPKNAKFIPKSDGTGYRIHNNFFGVRSGTQIIPEGYEVRRNWLGFAIVVPKGTEGLFIRSL